MLSETKNSCWYVLFATNGKAEKISHYFQAVGIKCFFPFCYRERKIRNCERKRFTLQPVLRNLVFVKSSKKTLKPHLQEIKLRLCIDSELYYRYRDGEERKIIVVPEAQMQNFMLVACCTKERIVYLTNEAVNLDKGAKVRIIDGVFEGVEGIFMRIKGKNRVVVSLSNLISVANASIPTHYILPLE